MGESVTYDSESNKWQPGGVEGPTPIGEVTPTPIPCPKPTEERQNGTGSITFKGVTLRTYIPEAQTIDAVLVPSVCLEYETDKPDGIAPQHVSLRLNALEAFHQNKTFYDPEIVIFPIEGFRIILANTSDGFEYVQETMKKVRRILKEQPPTPKGLPEPQIYDDGSRTIYTHVKYASFNGIKGVFYLTHFDIEPSLIGNDRLIYVFQGLTNDGKYYVSATLPVTLNWVPDYEAEALTAMHFRMTITLIRRNGNSMIKSLNDIFPGCKKGSRPPHPSSLNRP